MKPLCFHKYAKAEAIKASEFYEKQQQNLGKRFVAKSCFFFSTNSNKSFHVSGC